MPAPALADLARRWWGGELGAVGAALDVALLPAEWLFRTGVRARNAAYDAGWLGSTHPGIPVISVGNLTVGGAGKTPVSAWLLQELLRRGRRPALLHGGYASDEPALHRLWAPDVPVIAERDRVAAALGAKAAGADVLVLDDAFQHRRIRRDLDIVLVAAERWSMRPRLLPRGGWREPPGALARAGLVVVTRRTASANAAAAIAATLAPMVAGGAVARVELRPGGWLDGEGKPTPPPGACLLVAAIAEPEAFEENARSAGAQVEGRRLWPDHHAYDAADARALRAEAAGRPLVTTAKDWIKLGPLLPGADVRVLTQEVVLEAGTDLLRDALERVLGG